MCQPQALSNRESIAISHCLHCQMMFIWHNNIMLNFTPSKFAAFHQIVNKLKYEDCCFPFPDKEERAIISTPNPEISFAFTYKEWLELKEVMDEAMYIKEVYAIMA